MTSGRDCSSRSRRATRSPGTSTRSATAWRSGARVIGWSGGYCGHCRSCRRGKFMHCEAGMVTGANVSRRTRPLRGGARERAGPPSRRTISY
ncbi:MAG TPA: alcohol dehydrogenase catalytic domain-containing protein [Mycobacterium sp.]|nr:alcohol dehydrogenase catalytic domain-containing protein [Mycobacterium sp.]